MELPVPNTWRKYDLVRKANQQKHQEFRKILLRWGSKNNAAEFLGGSGMANRCKSARFEKVSTSTTTEGIPIPMMKISGFQVPLMPDLAEAYTKREGKRRKLFPSSILQVR